VQERNNLSVRLKIASLEVGNNWQIAMVDDVKGAAPQGVERKSLQLWADYIFERPFNDANWA